MKGKVQGTEEQIPDRSLGTLKKEHLVKWDNDNACPTMKINS